MPRSPPELHRPQPWSRRPTDRDTPQVRAAAAPTWEEVAECYAGTVYRMAYSLTHGPDEACHLTQDVFVRMYRNLDRYRPGTFEDWL